MTLHIALAYITVAGFALRVLWAFTGSDLRSHKLVRILPHVIDTVLLLAGLGLVFTLGYPLGSAWLLAKFAALFGYIGFGVLALRASSLVPRLIGVLGAFACVAYLFAVAHSKTALPF